MTARRYWAAAAVLLGIVAVALPVGRVTSTLLADLQFLYVLALLALMGWLLIQKA